MMMSMMLAMRTRKAFETCFVTNSSGPPSKRHSLTTLVKFRIITELTSFGLRMIIDGGLPLVREGLGRFEQKMNHDNGRKIGWSTTEELMIKCSTKTGLMMIDGAPRQSLQSFPSPPSSRDTHQPSRKDKSWKTKMGKLFLVITLMLLAVVIFRKDAKNLWIDKRTEITGAAVVVVRSPPFEAKW